MAAGGAPHQNYWRYLRREQTPFSHEAFTRQNLPPVLVETKNAILYHGEPHRRPLWLMVTICVDNDTSKSYEANKNAIHV